MGDRRRPSRPPPYSVLPPQNNTRNGDPGPVQIDIPNERSSLLSAPPTAQRNAPSILLAILKSFLVSSILPFTIIFIIISFFSFLGAYERDIHRREAGVAWSSPVEESCVRYGSRDHSATLLNYVPDKYWMEACEWTRMNIHGKKMKAPSQCDIVDHKIIGHWHVDDGGCRPWFSAEDKQCAGSDKIISARLMYIENDTKWEDVCMTTPFHSGTKTYFPISCEDKGVDGIWGYIQMIRDEGCMKEERARRRREAGVVWDAPQHKSCVRSGVGEYSTVLLHYLPDKYWKEACETTELLFNGQTLIHPEKCEKIWQDGPYRQIVVASWQISNVSVCTPFWGSISYDHCVGTNKKMVSARLWNVKDAHLWDIMCATTPIILQGVPRLPLSCENKGFFGGVWGHWEIYDDSCNVLHE